MLRSSFASRRVTGAAAAAPGAAVRVVFGISSREATISISSSGGSSTTCSGSSAAHEAPVHIIGAAQIAAAARIPNTGEGRPPREKSNIATPPVFEL
jgi:hypothetical protein